MSTRKQKEIEQLKEEKAAVILAHYYVSPEVQAIADYIGDSYYLSKIAKELTNETIIFCGVTFMGESAKLLSPAKTVLMPSLTADCPMAHMVTYEEVVKARKEYEDLAVLCYINTTAEIKSWSDVCVTSSNAVEIARNLPNKNILFIPDKNLGAYVASQVPEKHFIFNAGHCPIHEEMLVNEITSKQKEYPAALLLVHPECNAQIRAKADYIGSTTGIITYASQSEAHAFIIATESGIDYVLKKENPAKDFYYPQTHPICAEMKKVTLDQIIHVLKTGENAIEVEASYFEAAAKTLMRMHEYAS